MIGAMIMVHGDDKGLVVPPRVAPVQVVIVPIPYKGTDEQLINETSKQVYEDLRKAGIEVVLDERTEYTPGWKFNEWELKGVPIRIEIGPRDVKQNQVLIVRRDNRQKTPTKQKEIADTILRTLDDLQDALYERARKQLQENITTVKSYEEFKRTLETKGGFLRALWCGNSDCELKIKEETGATIRLIPFEKEELAGRCVSCGREAKEVVYFARAY